MTQNDILKIAVHQSALDLNAADDDFSKQENVITKAGLGPHARKYLKEPIAANLVSYGNNVVASVKDEYRVIISEYLSKFEFFHCFETPNVLWLDERMKPHGFRVCFMAEYWLPDLSRLHRINCKYKTKILTQKDFTDLYLPEWSNALCENRKELDVLGIAAYDNGKMVGFAACSADADEMWQIGVDVLPDYRRQGIASSLTSNLACEILARGKVPFYCCAWSNMRSAGNAIKSGFNPAWAEMTLKLSDYVEEINK